MPKEVSWDGLRWEIKLKIKILRNVAKVVIIPPDTIGK